MKGDVNFRQLRSLCSSILSPAVFAVAIFLTAPLLRAQSTGGRIRGTVTDTSGGAVTGAQVALVNEATNVARKTESGATGEYLFLEVPVGSYEIEVIQKGFKKYVRKGINLDLNAVVSVDITLQVGGTTETIEVTGAPPVVDTTSTQLGAVMNDVAVKQLPLNTRDTYQLLQLQPGVQSQLGSNLFYGSDQPGVVSVNGGRGRSNNYSVNGGDANDAFVNLPAIQPSPDAIQEFRVITNTFDAEFGRNSGSVVNVVTKSGTNQVHGDVFEFFRNKVLNARGFFDTVKPDSKQNQFGGTLGGPVRKDRTFIFGSYEGRRVRRGITSDVVTDPTATERGGDFGPLPGTLTSSTVATMLQERCNSALTPTGQTALVAAVAGTPTPYSSIFTTSPTGSNPIPTACFDPVALNLFNQFVAPQDPNGTGSIVTVPVGRDRSDQFTIRVDHKLSSSQQFNAYYYFNDRPQFQPFSFFQAAGANVPGFGDFNTSRVQQWNLSHTWTIGSNAVNEFRFSYFREGQRQLDHPQRNNLVTNSCTGAAVGFCFNGNSDVAIPGVVTPNPKLGITPNLGPNREGVPFITVAGGFTIGNNFEGELPQVGNSFQWSDNYSKVIGKHSLKFGGDVRRVRFDQFLFFEVNGFTSFTSGGPNSPSGCPTPTPPSCTPAADLFSDYFLGLPTSYAQGSAQGENVRESAVYLFAQDSWKIKPSLTLNYGLRWELNTPIYDTRNRVQTFRPGQADTVFPCQISPNGSASTGYPVGSSCAPGTPQESVFPLGMVVPGDKGIPRGLTQTYYNAFAPRIAWPGVRAQGTARSPS